MVRKDKRIIGWREYVDLPEWGIRHLKAKIDTGAKSCSVHGEDIKDLGDGRISFYLVLDKKEKRRKRIVAEVARQGKVKSSIGVRTRRYYVETTLKMGPVVRKVKINIMGREEMTFRMLIGRTAIEDEFLVDVDHGYLLGNKSARKHI